jgi:hypothetical protein
MVRPGVALDAVRYRLGAPRASLSVRRIKLPNVSQIVLRCYFRFLKLYLIPIGTRIIVRCAVLRLLLPSICGRWMRKHGKMPLYFLFMLCLPRIYSIYAERAKCACVLRTQTLYDLSSCHFKGNIAHLLEIRVFRSIQTYKWDLQMQMRRNTLHHLRYLVCYTLSRVAFLQGRNCY